MITFATITVSLSTINAQPFPDSSPPIIANIKVSGTPKHVAVNPS
jgi:hypothetical protein